MVSTTPQSSPSKAPLQASFPQRFAPWLTQIEAALAQQAQQWTTELAATPVGSSTHMANQRLGEAMAHALLGGGKRIRPLLVCLVAAGFTQRVDESTEGAPDSPQHVLSAAMAIEMLHTYSLVHDDLPAMDNDTLRRGQPTVHYQYGEAMGILVGDALQAEAYALLANHCPNHPQLVAELAQAAGLCQLIRGQWLDLSLAGRRITLDEVMTIHTHKTGALFGAAMAMGGIAAHQPMEVITQLRAMGHQLGTVFQIADDLLDTTATAAELGKSAGKDAGQDKNSILKYCTVPVARAHAELAQQGFLQQLAALPFVPARRGLIAQHLEWLCNFMLARRA